MKKIEEYIGAKFGRLKVLGVDQEFVGRTYNANHWLFKCDCGAVISETPSRVLSGHKQSCGCRKASHGVKHGLYSDPFYHTWWSMMQRCNNPKHHGYNRYGARGIDVCDEWRDVAQFAEWAHNTYPKSGLKYTLDRIDNNKGYSPENCRWATAKVQMNNRRKTIFATVNGETKPISEWCEIYRMPLQVVSSRIRIMKWDALKALTTPVTHFDERGVLVEIGGVRKTIKDWCSEYGIKRTTVYGRMRKGMDAAEAITKPLRGKTI